MDLNHLREYGVLTLEPKIEGLPKEIHWWKPLELDEKRIKLVSDPGRYYLEIRSDQIERLISFADKINGVEGCALVLTGRFSYEQLQFVFRPHPPIEPVYAICDTCGKPILTHQSSKPAFDSSTISDNFTQCRHCGALKKWSKADLWPLKVVKEQFTTDVIEKS